MKDKKINPKRVHQQVIRQLNLQCWQCFKCVKEAANLEFPRDGHQVGCQVKLKSFQKEDNSKSKWIKKRKSLTT